MWFSYFNGFARDEWEREADSGKAAWNSVLLILQRTCLYQLLRPNQTWKAVWCKV